MTEADVDTFLAEMAAAQLDFWITGGWGIDALVGRCTRIHNDLDISVDARSLDQVLALVGKLGYVVATDWLPVRVAVRDQAGREIDIHPIVFEEDGSAWLPALEGDRFNYPVGSFTTGTIGARSVPCISAELQLAFHRGYELTEKDCADIGALASAGLIGQQTAAELCDQ